MYPTKLTTDTVSAVDRAISAIGEGSGLRDALPGASGGAGPGVGGEPRGSPTGGSALPGCERGKVDGACAPRRQRVFGGPGSPKTAAMSTAAGALALEELQVLSQV